MGSCCVLAGSIVAAAGFAIRYGIVHRVTYAAIGKYSAAIIAVVHAGICLGVYSLTEIVVAHVEVGKFADPVVSG